MPAVTDGANRLRNQSPQISLGNLTGVSTFENHPDAPFHALKSFPIATCGQSVLQRTAFLIFLRVPCPRTPLFQ